MTTRRTLLAAVLIAGGVTAGCEATDDISARYALERRLWRAQFYQRRIQISFLQASRTDMRLAVDAYQQVLVVDPLANPASASWDRQVADDIRQIQISARVALANIYFLSQRYADAGTMYQQTIQSAPLTTERELELRLGAARSLYMAGETNSAIAESARLFREIVDEPAFWTGQLQLDDVFLNIPIVVVRMYREAGDAAAYEEYSTLAANFYERIAEKWPRDRMGEQARLGRIQLHLVRSEWDAAVRAIEALKQQAQPGAGLELVLGEIHAFARRDRASATRVLSGILERYPGTDAASAARYDLAILRSEAGERAAAVEELRAIEQDERVPTIVVARAMLSRARILESMGRWDDALVLLRRTQQLYPHTPSALEAPMLIVKHYLDARDPAGAERALDRAREYYLSLIDRSSQYGGDRLLVQGALATAYVMNGRAAEVADLFASPAPQWDDDAAAVGLLRAADLYAGELGDPARAEEMLKKCIERFPETRYSRLAQRRLNELPGRP